MASAALSDCRKDALPVSFWISESQCFGPECHTTLGDTPGVWGFNATTEAHQSSVHTALVIYC